MGACVCVRVCVLVWLCLQHCALCEHGRGSTDKTTNGDWTQRRSVLNSAALDFELTAKPCVRAKLTDRQTQTPGTRSKCTSRHTHTHTERTLKTRWHGAIAMVRRGHWAQEHRRFGEQHTYLYKRTRTRARARARVRRVEPTTGTTARCATREDGRSAAKG